MREPTCHVPLWLAVSLAEAGITEIPGGKHNPRIMDYHRATKGRQKTPDEIAWCSSHVNWCMDKSGEEGTGSKRARSWLDWGQRLDAPMLGCVVILWRESPTSPKGHVGFWLAEHSGKVWVWGGNQGNQVNARAYPKSRVLGYRWPV